MLTSTSIWLKEVSIAVKNNMSLFIIIKQLLAPYSILMADIKILLVINSCFCSSENNDARKSQ